jgi:eukaryotic-like serine/threonine-protein kinase
MPEASQVLADYVIQRLIGRGSSGSVHLAQDRRDGSWVALKLLTLAGHADDEEREAAQARFLREAATARQLRHADIVALLDAGQTQQQSWLALELVPGGDLTRYTAPTRLLPEAMVLRIGQRVATALAHAHGAGFVHRDVKPSNILAHWPSDTLKLGDFGVARGVDAQATRTGVVLGSPAYLAPEQLGGALAEPRTDLYALGVTLFQLLCGRLPFAADSMGALLHAVATQAAPDLAELRPDLPRRLARLLAAMLSKSARDRPSNAAQVAAELEALQRDLAAAGAPGRVADVPMSRP